MLKVETQRYFFSGRGEIWSFTQVFDAPEGYELYTPYYVALIKLDEGPMISAQLTDLDPNTKPKIGMRVEMVTRKLRELGPKGQIIYGGKYRLEGEIPNFTPNPRH